MARDVGFVVIRVNTGGVRRNGDGILEVGPEASHDAIATEACRRMAELKCGGRPSEAVVAALVEEHGYTYEPSDQSGLFFSVG